MKKYLFSLLILIIVIMIYNIKSSNLIWDKTFAKSDKVYVKKVSFKNRYGIKLVGDLYIPKNFKGEKMPAIAVAGPFGAVKEQAAGTICSDNGGKRIYKTCF